ncbi:unnamed protein product [Diamesa tonsa]
MLVFFCVYFQSFFGRSYNNLSSITECKNNGECAINKKNRTACKACRLRKCLLVGMSKSGSRYGRRSNWFKIHCLLQEQQQAAAAAHQNGGQNPPQLSPNSLNLMGHPSYASNFFTRPPCTKEELMLLGLDEYSKHPTSAASPSISSPDSHNSESSIEIGDKRSSLLNVKHQNKHQPNTSSQTPTMTPLSLNKDLFLPLQFGGLPFMPPPGFLQPSSHMLFSSYHNALYQHHHQQLQQQQQQQQQQQYQGLLKTTDSKLNIPSHSPLTINNNNHSNENNNNIQQKSSDIKHQTKRFNLDAVLELQKNALHMKNHSLLIEPPKKSNSPSSTISNKDDHDDVEDIEDEDEDIDMNDDNEEELTMTPPRSPSSLVAVPNQSVPIDLSMKSGSSSKSSDINHNHYKKPMINHNSNHSSADNSSADSHSDNDSSDDKIHKDLKRKLINHHLTSTAMKINNEVEINRYNKRTNYGDNDSDSECKEDLLKKFKHEHIQTLFKPLCSKLS